LNFRPLHGEEVEQSLGHEGIKLLMMMMVVSFSRSESESVGSAIAVRGSMILTGRTGVLSVTRICLKLGHARDHAGWGPLQEGSFAGHRFGGWLSGHLGQMAFLVHSA
jgi:hypothetical protein